MACVGRFGRNAGFVVDVDGDERSGWLTYGDDGGVRRRSVRAMIWTVIVRGVEGGLWGWVGGLERSKLFPCRWSVNAGQSPT